ncbi:tripartite tricarboxylate transporter substrate binding protein [Pseudorhodoferax sp. LjRoot39]
MAALAGAAALTGTALAETFPARPVTLIVPWPAGGSADAVLRALAKATEPHLGQPIVVDNKPGAAGTLGPTVMSKTAKPDGYTVSQVSQTQFRLPHMQKVNYDPIKDFSYVIRLTGYTFGVVVDAKSPFKTLSDLIAHAKKNPGKLSYGSGGTGTSHHVAIAALADRLQLDMQHVPFKGSSENLVALLGGHVDAASDSTGWAPYLQSGRMRLLATYGSERAKKWPDVPTLNEIAPGLVFDSPYGLAAPAGTPAERVKVLHDAFKKGMEEPEFLRVMENFDQTPRYMNTADYTADNIKTFADERVLMHKLGLAKE